MCLFGKMCIAMPDLKKNPTYVNIFPPPFSFSSALFSSVWVGSGTFTLGIPCVLALVQYRFQSHAWRKKENWLGRVSGFLPGCDIAGLTGFSHMFVLSGNVPREGKTYLEALGCGFLKVQ